MKTYVNLCALLTFLFASLSWAQDVSPNKCPTVTSIIEGGLTSAEKDETDGVYVAGQVNRYDTTVAWAFLVAVPFANASSSEDALIKARSALPELTGNPIPLRYSDKWLCVYDDLGNGYKAVAVTPVNLQSLSHLSIFKV